MAKVVADYIAEKKIQVQILNAVEDSSSKFPPAHYLYLDVSRLKTMGWEPAKELKEIYLRMMMGM